MLLDKQSANILALSQGDVNKYESLTGKYILQEKDLLEEAAEIKRFEYLSVGNELKKQTDIAVKQYKRLDNACEVDIIKKQQLKDVIDRISSTTANEFNCQKRQK